MKNKAIKYFIIIIGFIIIVEILIRLSGAVKTHTEKNFGDYVSAYRQQFSSSLFTFSPKDSFTIQSSEYKFEYITNETGLVKNKACTRNDVDSVVVLGDSFTFGAGAPQDSSMPVLLNNMSTNGQCYINAGMPGSDPFFEAQLMNKIFMPKGYKHFIYVMNVSDLYDYIFRGGEERFLPNGKIQLNAAPWYGPLYRYSHLCRAIIHVCLKTDFSLLPEQEIKSKKLEAIHKYVLLFEKLQRQIKNKRGTLKVVIHPYPLSFSNNISTLYKEVMNYSYMNELYHTLLQNNINTYNLYNDFNKAINNSNYTQYSWEIDGHFNAKGYQLFAEILNEKLGQPIKENL